MAKPKQAAKCVAIANDVLKQIRLRKYVPLRGTYLGSETVRQLRDAANEKGDRDMQPLVKKVMSRAKPCEVCMVGAAFVSCVSLYDKFEIGDVTDSYIDDDDMREVLSDYFAEREIIDIEDVFEQTNDMEDGLGQFVSDPEEFNVVQDGMIEVWCPESEEAMSAICNNIVRNRGNFVKSDVERDFRAIFDKLTKKSKRIPILEEE